MKDDERVGVRMRMIPCMPDLTASMVASFSQEVRIVATQNLQKVVISLFQATAALCLDRAYREIPSDGR